MVITRPIQDMIIRIIPTDTVPTTMGMDMVIHTGMGLRIDTGFIIDMGIIMAGIIMAGIGIMAANLPNWLLQDGK